MSLTTEIRAKRTRRKIDLPAWAGAPNRRPPADALRTGDAPGDWLSVRPSSLATGHPGFDPLDVFSRTATLLTKL